MLSLEMPQQHPAFVANAPQDARSDTSSPMVRVCDTPDSVMSPASSYASASSPRSSVSSPPCHPSGLIPPLLFPPLFPLLPSAFPSQLQLPHQVTKGPASKPLSFSIDSILRSDFGSLPPKKSSPAAKQTARTAPARSQAHPPKPKSSPATAGIDIEKDIPVDLSKTSNEAPKQDSDCPPGMVRGPNGQLLPAWVFCTRYSDRPSSGPRARKIRKKGEPSQNDKRPRTAFSVDQLARLRKEFLANRYLTEERRKSLSQELGLNENQIKIWFQNKRAKIKKSTGDRGELAKMLEAQGLYNHQTMALDEEEELLMSSMQ